MRIMVVDDNSLMRKEIVSSVALKTDAVLECADGESALLSCLEFRPDWILMDIKMRNINGISAAEKIKKMNSKARIAFVTSYDNFSYRQKAKSIGIEFYFLKNDLLSIRQTLENNKYSNEA